MSTEMDSTSAYIVAAEQQLEEEKQVIARMKTFADNSDETKYITIPASHWWQFMDIFTRRDELLLALLKLGNLQVGRLDSIIGLLGGVIPPGLGGATRVYTTYENIGAKRIVTSNILVAVPLFSGKTDNKDCVILAPITNSPAGVLVGDKTVAPPDTGFPLAPGGVVPNIHIDDLSKLHYYSTVATDVLILLWEW